MHLNYISNKSLQSKYIPYVMIQVDVFYRAWL